MKKVLLGLTILSATLLSGCGSDASVASANMSKAADQFEVQRRTVFYNGITGEYMLELTGKCSIKDSNRQLEVICKVGSREYSKHFLGLSDNVSYFVEQLEPLPVSVYHNRIIWKPQSIIPNIDINGSMDDMVETLTK